MISVYHNDSAGVQTANGDPWELSLTAEVVFYVTLTAGSFKLQRFDKVAGTWKDVVDVDATWNASDDIALLLGQSEYRIVGTGVGVGDHVEVSSEQHISKAA